MQLAQVFAWDAMRVQIARRSIPARSTISRMRCACLTDSSCTVYKPSVSINISRNIVTYSQYSCQSARAVSRNSNFGKRVNSCSLQNQNCCFKCSISVWGRVKDPKGFPMVISLQSSLRVTRLRRAGSYCLKPLAPCPKIEMHPCQVRFDIEHQYD